MKTLNPIVSFIQRRPKLSFVIFLIFLVGLLWISTQMPAGEKVQSETSSYKKVFAEGEVDSILNSGGEIKATICEDSKEDACLGLFMSYAEYMEISAGKRPLIRKTEPLTLGGFKEHSLQWEMKGRVYILTWFNRIRSTEDISGRLELLVKKK